MLLFCYKSELGQGLGFEGFTSQLALLFFYVKDCPQKTSYLLSMHALVLKSNSGKEYVWLSASNSWILENQSKWHILLIIRVCKE